VGYPYVQPGGLQREFRMVGGGFGKMALPFVAMLVFFAAIMLLLGSIVAGLLSGITAAVIGTGALVGVLYAKFNRMKQGTVVRFSEYGVELSDTKGFRVRLNWPDITRVGQVDTQMANPGAVGEDNGVQVSVGAMKSQGIIGWGGAGDSAERAGVDAPEPRRAAEESDGWQAAGGDSVERYRPQLDADRHGRVGAAVPPGPAGWRLPERSAGLPADATGLPAGSARLSRAGLPAAGAARVSAALMP
jgi:hypothetical protein